METRPLQGGAPKAAAEASDWKREETVL